MDLVAPRAGENEPPEVALAATGARGPLAAVGRRIPLELVVFVVAAICRLTVIFRSAGPRGFFGYDAAVYFGAADALTHGRVPYRDFVLLHPPGLMLVLTPFAWLTRVTSDSTAFGIANVSFALLGAINAVLVMRLCRQLGWSSIAALTGALFYATWFGAVGAEYLTKLEPLGNFLFLCGLLAAVKAQQRSSAWLCLLAGAAFGLTVSVKIWWIVPALAVIAWSVFATRRARAAVQLLAGALGAALLVNLPFFLLAPHQMWSSVIQEQLGRNQSASTTLVRIADLTQVTRLGTHVGRGAPLAVLVLLTGAVFVGVVVRAWRRQAARPAVVLVIGQLAVILAAPSWFDFYSDYVAIGMSLVVAAAAARRDGAPGRTRASVAGWIPTVGAALITALVLVLGSAVVQPFHGNAQLARSVAGVRCVMSDSPMGEIELNALSRGLADGCRNWIDVTGRTYGPDRPPAGNPARTTNLRWQRDLTDYLRSGQAIIIVRATGTGVSKKTFAAIRRDGVLARIDHHSVYRVTHTGSATGSGNVGGR